MSLPRLSSTRTIGALSSLALVAALLTGASAASAEVTPPPAGDVSTTPAPTETGEAPALDPAVEPTEAPLEVPALEDPAAVAPQNQPTPEEGEPVEAELTAAAAAASGSVPVYRFYSPKFGGHHYTTSVSERDHILRTWPTEWQYEGVRYNAYTSEVAGSVPVYRFWSEWYKAHFFTTSAAEKADVERRHGDIWKYEGIAYYAYPVDANISGSNEVDRFWSTKLNRHFYTADRNEAQTVKTRWPDIWSSEGTRFRVLPGTAGAPLPELPKVQWPIARNVWTWSSSTNGFSSWHPGVDMMSPRNTPIYAIADGTVITSTEGSGSGLGVYIEVEHQINGQRVVSRYGHMQYGTREVARGTQVKKGQKLGGVGDSGNAYGTHLHFEVVVNGNKVDPMWWLPNNGADK